MNREKAAIRCDVQYYQNDKKAIEMVFRHVRGRAPFDPFWRELRSQPDIGRKFGRHKLYQSELVYEYFKTHGFAGYFEKQHLKSWEEVVFFIEDRKDYYIHRETYTDHPLMYES